MSLKILLDCKKAGSVCDKCQYDESGPIERFILHLHIKYCGHCRKHSQQNTKLSRLLRDADLKVMPEQDKNVLQNLIQQELSKTE